MSIHRNMASQNLKRANSLYKLALELATEDSSRKLFIIELLDYAAHLGNTDAMNALGVWYREGIGVKKNYKKALKFFIKAKTGGNLQAELNLGHAYANGIGTNVNFLKSKTHYIKAAANGIATAQRYIGTCYLFGKNKFPQMPKLAFRNFKKAATKGDIESIYALGYCYELGKGVRKNTVLAKKYYRIASKKGHRGAVNALKKKLKNT